VHARGTLRHARADDLADGFDFAQEPRAFTQIAAPHSAAFLIEEPIATDPPDND